MPPTPSPTRCRWASTDPLLRDYHDTEWGVPVHDARLLWETLCLESFQAGLSWLIVLRRRDGFRRAFAGFDPDQVARFDEADVDRLMDDAGIIRARAKIVATIGNARAFCAMRDRGEDFARFAWGLVPDAPIVNRTGTVLAQSPDSVALSKALKARGFTFVGPVIVYAWMQAVGMVDDHDPACFRHAGGHAPSTTTGNPA
ncbi:DNA-3-methyladenine glycosylase I [Ameyamaea chiangmaiensis NBRC 103196]|uniref:DNA-3-methyladenine glycosylase I n=1 Tax=Ameyamaea chiangmaiensis TaxID=442969 RepID=A0A850PD52_9PROT|nr:DNA-3-methyladenine glycosylase I [Ameyamaea chiangmaiensis]MBS4075168.1 DNA-3-methyladenine glycosylase I [Ameyamaea chiangmaiensis]NVN40216.1 DNA-3-methyladenine glycosylase I [Ameyamaea chiangmaiensis]GBQ66294.1 DNA-3-methyladenine glycosylase I [Ameyamaea chiangmaiensis NBRC 103196]